MRDMHRIVKSHDVVLVTLDTLRYDVAVRCLEEGRIPNLASVLPDGWEKRHAPGNFTYASHQAMFAGFLPTPAGPGVHSRPFALRFDGSETISEKTWVFDAPDIVHGLADCGYHTVCVGGVGFFNKANPLGNVLPGMFAESHWSEELGVTDPESTAHQVSVAVESLERLPQGRRVFLFVNVSALHQPNHFYMEGASGDSLETHAGALEYVDAQLGRLLDAFRARGRSFWIVCSDHGTAYGEDGYVGHRVSHPVVWTVPYGEFVLGDA